MALQGSTSTTLAGLASAFYSLSNGTQRAVLFFAFVAALYGAWRIWRFSLRPMLSPHDPPPLPYWIPVVGHAIGMFRNQHALLKYGRDYFHSQPFALVVAGKTIYIQTALEDIAATYKNNSALSFDESVKEFMTLWGLSEHGAAKMWESNRTGPYPNPHGKAFGPLSRDIQRSQLESAQGLAEVTDKFEAALDPYLRRDGIPEEAVIAKDESSLTVSLLRLCRLTLIPAGTDTFFGKLLRQLRPGLDESFSTFDLNSWQLLFQLPPSMAKEMHCAKEEVLGALSQFVDAPASEKEDASWMVRTFGTEMDSMSMSTRDQAVLYFLMYWLINVNSWKLSFWIFAFVLSSPSLLQDIQKELSPGPLESDGNESKTKSRNSGDNQEPTMEHLLQRCPTLNAVFEEALRITLSASSTRSVMSDAVLNGRTYRAGATIIMPYRQLHFNQSTFGASPDTFDHTRFLAKKGALGRSPHFKPFGGGNTLCAGRFVARREVLLMVARMFGRFDMELCDNQTWPEMDMLKPGLGVMEAKEGQDLRVRLRERVRS